MKAGIILVIIGVFFLLKNLGFLAGISADIFWPIVLILIGVWCMVRRGHHRCMWCHGHTCGAYGAGCDGKCSARGTDQK